MAKERYYAIAKGEVTGVLFADWDAIKSHVVGYSGARYKAFDTEDAAIEWYNTNAPVELERGGIVAYVDGSNTGDGDAASWAYVIGEENTDGELIQVISASCGRVMDHHLPNQIDLEDALKQRNILGELIATIECLLAIAQLKLKVVVPVFHDYEGIGMWATGAWKARSSLAQRYQKIAQMHLSFNTVQFVHIKGHTGITGNEIVDQLAGFALGRSAKLPAL